MAVGYHRKTVAIIDCKALYDNIKIEQSHLPKDTAFFAVVKADGYGHGAVKVAEIARKAGVNGFCVAVLDEALELREAGFTEPILILGHVAPKYAALLVENQLAATVSTTDWLVETAKYLKEAEVTQPLKIHVKLDTGMGRIGFWQETEMQKANDYLLSHPDLYEFEGLFTHFSSADQKEESYFHKQQARWQQFRKIFPENLPYIHTSNSAVALWHDAWDSNMVRYGISLYGLNPSGDALGMPFPLKAAMELRTELIEVKRLPKGESIGYGATYTTQTEEWIGTLPIGYADGLRRQFSGFEVLIEGEKAKIVGRICMDQCMIRLPREFPVGTKVVIFGASGNQYNALEDGAKYVGTISYELCCEISQRVPRIYINEEQIGGLS